VNRNTRENVIQITGLVLAMAGGYLIWGWAGVPAGFVLFAVAIVVRVRYKMAKAQEIGKQQRAAREAAREAARQAGNAGR
jgi:heme exporter protein D